MSVCLTESVLRFYGCCHPCSFYYPPKAVYNTMLFYDCKVVKKSVLLKLLRSYTMHLVKILLLNCGRRRDI